MPELRNLIGCIALAALSPAWALEPDELYAKVSPSIVVVVGYSVANPDESMLGSGVVIAPGQIITNCHVVESADFIHVKRGEFTTLAMVRFSDPDRDLCQITSVNKRGFDRAITGVVAVSELRVGQKVYAVGAPQGLELTLSDGLISALREMESGTVIQTNAPMSPGSSGGGLFDATGRLIGITTFQSRRGQNLNFAVPAGWILELPSRHVEREKHEKELLHEEAKRLEEKKELEAEERRLEEEHRAEEEARLAAEEARRREQEELELEEEARRLEEQKQTEEQHHAQGLYPDEERRERAAALERDRQQGEAHRKQREVDEAKRRVEAAARAAQQKLIDDWKARIQAKIKGRVVVPANIQGNPEARFDVVLLPGGEVLSVTLRKSSGVATYDAAVERAIMAAQPLPVPSETDLFQANFRELSLVFRAKGEELQVAVPSVAPQAPPVAAPAPPQPVALTKEPSVPTVEPRFLQIYSRAISVAIKRYQKYPPLAQRRGWEGTPEVLLQIDADGKVTSITLGKSCGRSILDEEALNMVRRASPLPQPPPELRGREFTLTVPIVFRLHES